MTIDEAIVHAREVASRKFDDRVHCIKCAEEHEQLAEWLEELKQYRAIGTQDECLAAVEKQKEKKPPVVNRPSIFVKVPVCPNCSTQEHYQPLYGKTKYCSNCGQKIDWSDEE